MTYTPKTQTIYSNYRIFDALEDPWFYSHKTIEVCCQFCEEPWSTAVDYAGVPLCCAEAQSDYEAQTGLTPEGS